jgi:hypothetical protein
MQELAKVFTQQQEWKSMQGCQTTLMLKAIGEQIDVGTCRNL